MTGHCPEKDAPRGQPKIGGYANTIMALRCSLLNRRFEDYRKDRRAATAA